MSTPTSLTFTSAPNPQASLTNFKTGGTDLNNLFAPGSGGSITGLKNNSKDLSEIFAPIGTSTALASNTGFTANGTDIKNLFAAYSSSSRDFIDIVPGSKTTSLTFSSTVTAWVLLVGGGGKGGTGFFQNSIRYGGQGGSGGEIKYFDRTLVPGSYTFEYQVGAGGTSASTVALSSTILKINTVTQETARGGNAGASNLTYSTSYNENTGGIGSGIHSALGNTTTYGTPATGSGGLSLTFNSVSRNIGGGGGGGSSLKYGINGWNDDILGDESGGAGSNGGGNGGAGSTNFGEFAIISPTIGIYGGGGGGGQAGFYVKYVIEGDKTSGSQTASTFTPGAKGGDGLVMVVFIY